MALDSAPANVLDSAPASPLAYVLDDVFLGHRAPAAHPERPERLEAVCAALCVAGLENYGHRLPTRPASPAELGLVHTANYIAELEDRIPNQAGWLDGDTYYCADTWPATLAAAGATIDLTRTVLDGQFRRGLAVVRPPGHHAEADRAMGFCLVNNVAVAAAAARAAGAERVAIFDWDVHHGNGTQHIFQEDPCVLYMSCHQYPFYPGTGACAEVGVGAGVGTTVNVGFAAGCGDGDYIAAFNQVFGPALRRFRPDLVLLSAGFDAHDADPLGGMRLGRGGFRALSHKLVAVADEVCEGRLVCALEGGYALGGLAEGVTELLGALEPACVAAEYSVADEVARVELASPLGAQAIGATLAAHLDSSAENLFAGVSS